MNPQHDVARTRLDNALLLFDEFVQAAVKVPDAATLRGLERRFAERLQIQPSYWSQIKSRSRQIGERLARQFEQLCRKPVGWMDLPHPAGGNAGMAASSAVPSAVRMPLGTAPAPAGDNVSAQPPSQPQDDDERFIIGLVLTYYRRHPQRARTRLLDLLGEVLTPAGAEPRPAPLAPSRGAAPPPGSGRAATRAAPPAPTQPADDLSLWLRTQTGVAPLKRKP
jgi:hypothetical protein